MASFSYGGQALIEGVSCVGARLSPSPSGTPTASIVWAVERLDVGVRASLWLKLPFLRGLVVLYDTLVTGTRWLVRSATLQALALEEAENAGSQRSPAGGRRCGNGHPGCPPRRRRRSGGIPPGASAPSPQYSNPGADGGSAGEGGLGKGYAVAVGLMLIVSFGLGIGIFFLLPLFLASITIGRFDQGFLFQLSEGIIRWRSSSPTCCWCHGPATSAGPSSTTAPSTCLSMPRGRRPADGRGGVASTLPPTPLRHGVPGRRADRLDPGLRPDRQPAAAPDDRLASPAHPSDRRGQLRAAAVRARHRQHAAVRWLWSPGIWVQMITTRRPATT